MRPLGEVQCLVLRALDGNGGYWFAGCGWVWDNSSSTARILETFVTRGLVLKRFEHTRTPRYILVADWERLARAMGYRP